MDRVAYLEWVIKSLDTQWDKGISPIHPDTGIVVSDGEYDALRLELKTLAPNSTIFDTVTASELEDEESTDEVEIGTKKVKHHPPMTSIEKASHQNRDIQEQMLYKWMDDAVDEDTEASSWQFIAGVLDGEDLSYPSGFFYQQYKLDGVSLALYYEKGKLVSAGLRPRNGILGEDVTEQVAYVPSIPQRLKLPVTCSIRGELICTLSDFEKVQAFLEENGEKKRANPRNHAAGGIRKFKNPEEVKDMRLSFIGHSIEGLAKPPYKTEIERAIWANKELGVPFVQTREFHFEDLQKMEDNVPNLNYRVDGVVIGVNEFEVQEQLGRHGDKPTGNPRGKIAWKFAEERAGVSVKSIEWNTNRTGSIRPVAIFDAVRLADTDVGRATLHNYGFMKRGKIGIGTTIQIMKAGSIIPKVVGVLKGQISGEPPYPKQCPSCGRNTKVVEGGMKDGERSWDLFCENDDCPAKNVSVFCHFLKTIGVLGLAESKVEVLLESGKVQNFADLFKLSVEDAILAGMTSRQAMLAVADIHMVANSNKYEDDQLFKKIIAAKQTRKKISMANLFASFGIKSAGNSAGAAFAEAFRDFDKLRNASLDELVAVEGVGQKTAELVKDYLDQHKDDIDDLLKFVDVELPKTGKFTGMSFCFSGGFDEGKTHWEKIATDLGAKCPSSVSKTTNYLVAGEGSGSKSDKAKKYGVQIIDIDAFKKML